MFPVLYSISSLVIYFIHSINTSWLHVTSIFPLGGIFIVSILNSHLFDFLFLQCVCNVQACSHCDLGYWLHTMCDVIGLSSGPAVVLACPSKGQALSPRHHGITWIFLHGITWTIDYIVNSHRQFCQSGNHLKIFREKDVSWRSICP